MLQYVDLMVGQSPEGLLVAWRLADPMVALRTVARMVEPRCVGITAEQPS